MKYLNSLEAYYIVGGQDDGEGDMGSPIYDVYVSGERSGITDEEYKSRYRG